jgi:hypothetical protein
VSKRSAFVLAIVIAIGSLAPTLAAAQGLQTGMLSGIVKDPDGLPLPGATVTVTSPALQGERTVVTDAIGAYNIRGLPPGTYQVVFQFAGTQDIKQTIDVPLGGTAELDATLKLSGLVETVNVVADATPPPLANTQTSRNFTAELLSTIPVGRRPFEIAEWLLASPTTRRTSDRWQSAAPSPSTASS